MGENVHKSHPWSNLMAFTWHLKITVWHLSLVLPRKKHLKQSCAIWIHLGWSIRLGDVKQLECPDTFDFTYKEYCCVGICRKLFQLNSKHSNTWRIWTVKQTIIFLFDFLDLIFKSFSQMIENFFLCMFFVLKWFLMSLYFPSTIQILDSEGLCPVYFFILFFSLGFICLLQLFSLIRL